MKILRWDIPVDDAEHEITCGKVRYVDCRDPRQVTIWADDLAQVAREYRVFATGQRVGHDWTYVGTALSPALPPFANRGDLVWHLFKRASAS